MAATAILEVDRLSVHFGTPGTVEPAVSDLSFSVGSGEAVALVGESGCGKSTTALSIVQLLETNARLSGAIRFEGRDLVGLSNRDLRRVRGAGISMIFQEPMTSLNPVHTVGEQIIENIRQHLPLSRAQARRRALELLELVRFADPQRGFDAYPHQLSGGQRQRVMIAIAIACDPSLLIADEPTTALDATIQAQIFELLDELRRTRGISLLLITHDLSLVTRWTSRVVVMHHGQKMEEFATADLASPRRHPYTRGLVGASLQVDSTAHYRTARLPEIKVLRDEGGAYHFQLDQRPHPAEAPATVPAPLLDVRNLTTEYRGRQASHVAVRDVSLTIRAGESVGLVGESGSGKSSLSKTIMRFVPSAGGTISFRGEDITRVGGAKLRGVRRHVQMIFQDPYGSLNPRHSVGHILEEPLIVHDVRDRLERRRRVLAVLDDVGLPARSVDRMPHEFSGGQRQRIGIARALILRPDLVICDEPVSALDVSVQAQILNLLADLKQQFGLSYLFISHDLAVVRYISDRILVMKDAQIVEENETFALWNQPRHPYTRTLIASAYHAGAAPERGADLAHPAGRLIAASC